MEITGYGCGDHFYEPDTLLHSWEVLKTILTDITCNGILIDVGMPVGYNGSIYNCRIVALNGRIVLIRPKQMLANKEVFRESRWFTAWQKSKLIDFYLPQIITEISGQKTAPFGDALISLNDTCIAIETCEELWSQYSPNIDYYFNGAEIIFNGNGSNHVLRKLDQRIDLIQSACKKIGGVYVYTNLRGCDGERVYYDGGAMVALNGEIIGQSEQFTMRDVELLVSTVDLQDIRTYRYCRSRTDGTASISCDTPKVRVDYCLTGDGGGIISRPMKPRVLTPAQEVSLAPALWLWDNLRRSHMNGFFLPLSGGLDSASVACLVHSMCVQLVAAVIGGNRDTLADVRAVVSDPSYTPTDAKELCSRILVTCYMGSENNSAATKAHAKAIASDIGSSHIELAIDRIVAAFVAIVVALFARPPKFARHGGCVAEDLALQNVQARIRMVLAYFIAQLYLWSRQRNGALLVLSCGNLDECLRGYLTKYDCSSGDLNPIGSICKSDLRMLVEHCAREFQLASLAGVLAAPPTAELAPLLQDGRVAQTDEQDMGMTYEELSEFGKLRKVDCCGPYGMFVRLVDRWGRLRQLTPRQVADKVQHFFVCYAKNRHKMTVITPSYHVEAYNCDDNRFDLRPYLYNVAWTWQFQRIEGALETVG